MNSSKSFCLNPDCLKLENALQDRFCLACGSPTTVNGNAYTFQNGNYLVKNLLGEGAFGRAYQAIATNRLNHPCVIKKFIANFPNASDVQYARNAFEREAKQLLTLKHPQIPTLYEYLSYNKNGVPSLYLVLEWIEGQNLDDVWRSQGNFSPEQIRGLLLGVLPVLGYLHDNGMIHRDIKPNNIMLQRGTGKYVLIDFGGAKATSGTALASTRAIHTPGYAAIEQLRGMACEASDLYSLAATCVRLMTGIFPDYDQNGNVNDPIYDFLHDRWSWREFLEKKGIQIAPDLVTVLEKSLEARVVDRYHTAAQALQTLNPTQVMIPNMGSGGSPLPNTPSTQSGKTGVLGNPTPPVQPQQGLLGKLQQLYTSPPRQPVALPQQSATVKPASPTPQSPQIVYRNFVEDLGGGVKLEMIAIPLGSFKDAKGNIVKITEPFYMGKYQVTQAQWQAVMGNNPSQFKGQNLPVDEVSWNDCQKFIAKLNNTTGKIYRLPSEAEWEYCCRAVTSANAPVTEYCFGNDENLLYQYAWHDRNSGYGTHPVGQKKPNQFGLYDMHGNVWEWCEDSHVSGYQNPRIQKAYKHTTDERKILRGGSWRYSPNGCRSAVRCGDNAAFQPNGYGFRVACVGSRISP